MNAHPAPTLPEPPVPAACHALAQSLADDPFYRAITAASAHAAARLALLSRYFALAIAEAQACGEVQYAGAQGCAIWITDEAGPVQTAQHRDRRHAALRELLGPGGYDSYCRISAAMSAQVPAHLQEAWYLSILGVQPAARGRGLAAGLLGLTLDRADARRVACYLETFNPLSLPFYRRAGFVQEYPLHEPITDRPYWLLARPAR